LSEKCLNKQKFTTTEIKAMFDSKIFDDIKSISAKLEEINYKLAMSRRAGVEDCAEMELVQKQLQDKIKDLNSAIAHNISWK